MALPLESGSESGWLWLVGSRAWQSSQMTRAGSRPWNSRTAIPATVLSTNQHRFFRPRHSFGVPWLTLALLFRHHAGQFPDRLTNGLLFLVMKGKGGPLEPARFRIGVDELEGNVDS